MHINMMFSKLHRATVTQADIAYEGSITIDEDLLDLAKLKANQQVHIYNVSNGERFETYTIKGTRGSGIIAINGAAAHKVSVGDRVIIVAYALMDEKEASEHRPQVILLADNNVVKEIKSAEKELTKVL